MKGRRRHTPSAARAPHRAESKPGTPAATHGVGNLEVARQGGRRGNEGPGVPLGNQEYLAQEREAAQVAQQVGAHEIAPPAAAPPPAEESGAPLTPAMRGQLEPLVGADLAQVRVHTGPDAAAAADGLHAKAFTHGNHIWLGAGQSAGDVRLMAHESTHAVQQASSAPRIQRQPDDEAASDEPQLPEVGPNPLWAWPGVVAALNDEQYQQLCEAMEAQPILEGPPAPYEDPKDEAADLASRPVAASVDVPLRALLAADAIAVETGDLESSLVPLMMSGQPSSPLMALIIRNQILNQILSEVFPEPYDVTVSVVDGPLGGTLAFELGGEPIITDRGFIHIAQLHAARQPEIDEIAQHVAGQATAMGDAVDAIFGGRAAVGRLKTDLARIQASPKRYALDDVKRLAAGVRARAAALSSAGTANAAPSLAAELTELSNALAEQTGPLDTVVANAEAAHKEHSASAKTSQETLDDLNRYDPNDTDLVRYSKLNSSFTLNIANRIFSGPTERIDQAVLALREGKISMSSYEGAVSHEVGRIAIGFAVGQALGLVGAWVGAAIGGAAFGAATLGADLSAGFLGGVGAGVGTLGGEDLYALTVTTLSDDPFLKAQMSGSMHSWQEYLVTGAIGGGMGLATGGLANFLRGPKITSLARVPNTERLVVTSAEYPGYVLEIEGNVAKVFRTNGEYLGKGVITQAGVVREVVPAPGIQVGPPPTDNPFVVQPTSAMVPYQSSMVPFDDMPFMLPGMEPSAGPLPTTFGTSAQPFVFGYDKVAGLLGPSSERPTWLTQDLSPREFNIQGPYPEAKTFVLDRDPTTVVLNHRGQPVTTYPGHLGSPLDPPMLAPPIFHPGPFTDAQRAAFIRGTDAGLRLTPHHRHQLSIRRHGGVFDELPRDGHPEGNVHLKGNRHAGPSYFSNTPGGEALHKSEIRAYWVGKGRRLIRIGPDKWIDPGP
jgi:hypothetical protein